MAQVKGTAFKSRISYVQRHHGAEALDRVFAELEDRELAESLKKRAMPGGWYSFENYVDLLRTIDRVCGTGSGTMFRPMGAQVAEDDLSTVYRIFMRVASPSFILKKASHIWRQYYDVGELVVTRDQPDLAQFEICDMPNPDIAHCDSIAGWTQKCIEMTGASDVNVEHSTCRTRGDDQCIFEATWKI